MIQLEYTVASVILKYLMLQAGWHSTLASYLLIKTLKPPEVLLIQLLS